MQGAIDRQNCSLPLNKAISVSNGVPPAEGCFSRGSRRFLTRLRDWGEKVKRN
jgi:hypothetical protein